MASGMLVSEAIQLLIDNIELAAVTAGNLANQKMQQDFTEMAKGTVDSYYEYVRGQYTRYGRTHSLYNIYTVTTSLNKTAKNVNMTVTLNMDPGALEGIHHSNASQKWATVGGQYIFDNFMRGTHPWTNGWPQSGAAELKYREIKASPSVNRTINKYKKAYGDAYLKPYLDSIFMSLIKIYL